jgi:hypothetical protein
MRLRKKKRRRTYSEAMRKKKMQRPLQRGRKD